MFSNLKIKMKEKKSLETGADQESEPGSSGDTKALPGVHSEDSNEGKTAAAAKAARPVPTNNELPKG